MKYRTMSDCLYNVLPVFLGVSVTQTLVTNHLKVLFHYAGVVQSCSEHCTVFQAYVTSPIVQPGHKETDNADDIITSGTEYGFYPGMCVLLSDSSDWRFKEILSRRIPCYGEACTRRAIEKKDVAILLHTAYAENRKPYAACNKSVSRSFKQESMPRLAALHLEKGSFLKQYINHLIDSALEAGLNDFWQKNTLHKLRIKAAVGVGIILIDDNLEILLIHL